VIDEGGWLTREMLGAIDNYGDLIADSQIQLISARPTDAEAPRGVSRGGLSFTCSGTLRAT